MVCYFILSPLHSQSAPKRSAEPDFSSGSEIAAPLPPGAPLLLTRLQPPFLLCHHRAHSRCHATPMMAPGALVSRSISLPDLRSLRCHLPALRRYRPAFRCRHRAPSRRHATPSPAPATLFDPNRRQCLTMEEYREIGQIVHRLADLTYAPYCLHATLEGVLNLPAPLLSDPIAYYSEDEDPSMKVVDVIKGYWKDSISILKEVFL